MWLHNWLRSRKRPASHPIRSARRGRASTTRLFLEPLEDRTLLSAGWAISNGGTGTLGTYQEISAPDAAGNLYVTGYFSGTASFGTTTLNASAESSYVAKVDPNGNFLWATQIGGSASTPSIPAVALDGSGDVYVAGNFGGTASFGSTSMTSAGASDMYICKLDPNNGNVLWARQAGGASGDDAEAVAVDSSGNVFVTGMFDHGSSSVVSATFGSTTLTATCSNVQGEAPVYLSKLDTNGNFLWSEQLLGSTYGQPFSITGDKGGNMYVVGQASGFQGSSNSSFLEKVDTNGSIVWAKGTSGAMLAGTIFQDPTNGSISLYTSAYSLISKWDVTSNSAPNAPLWSVSFGGSDVRGRAITVDSSGTLYVAGQYTGNVDFDTGPGTAFLDSAANSYDSFLLKLDPSGNFLSARSMGGTGSNIGSSLTLDSSGNMYTAGSYQGTGTFDTGSQTVSLSSPGNTSLFLVKTTQATGMIFGRVFNDLNNNGVLDAGSLESGIPNVTVYLDLNNSGSYVAGDPTATTDAQGYYHFSDVTPGSYTLRQIVPSGYTATPAFIPVSVSAGMASEVASFADYTPNKTRTYSNSTAVRTSKGKPNAVSSLTVSDSYTVLGMTLAVSVSNNNHNNLAIFLTGPNGTKVSLGSTTQSGALSFQVPYFDYTAVKGTWTLEVDGLAGGTLNSWSMNIDGTMS